MQQQITRVWIDVPVPDPDGASILGAYVAAPTGPAPAAGRPTVLVGFEMFGVTGYVRRVADRVAGLGYTAVVPDFYHRLGDRVDLPATPAGRARGLELLEKLDRDGVLRDVHALLDHLGTAPSRCALLGLSVGGHLAYYLATQLPVAAAAILYPGWLTGTGIALSRPEPTLDLTGGIAAHGGRLLLLIGADDHVVTAAERRLIAERLRAEGVPHELVVYPATPHGFLCDERDTYRPEPARDAWDRITALLASAFGERA